MMIQLYIDICQKIQLSRQDITEKTTLEQTLDVVPIGMLELSMSNSKYLVFKLK